uniref:Uncharacterized protein n=1 Tax=Arundo donax TaxID=35708 RepID=A0A0A9B3R5_ARUDO
MASAIILETVGIRRHCFTTDTDKQNLLTTQFKSTNSKCF